MQYICICFFRGCNGGIIKNESLVFYDWCSILCAVLLYVSSHSTYYKYNDWFILQSNIHKVEQKYGKFDLGEIKDNEKGRAAYYIYTDNGPIMPDHMKHYYYMEYDEWGVIYNVYDGLQPGG